MPKHPPTDTPSEDLFDLDAVRAERAATERNDGKPPFKFRFDGDVYTCESLNDLDIRDFSEIITDEDPATILVAMLGEEQYERLDAAEATFSLADFEKLTEAYMDHFGMSVPKPSRSQRRSKARRIH